MPTDNQTPKSESEHSVTVIGGGLAGSEAALQLADAGVSVTLYEMRPGKESPAHHSAELAELVCSNSLKSLDPTTAAGHLKVELRALGSRLLAIAEETAVPAGAALAVDREGFSRTVTDLVEKHPSIELRREEATSIPSGRVILATGPLSSAGLDDSLSELVGADRLAFYDAAAPIVDAESIDRSRAFAASRYEKGEGADYLNCPLDPEQYERFTKELVDAARVEAKEFETKELFQACQPIEEIVRRSGDAVRFGAMKPVGLTDPATGERPWAVVQLRAETKDLAAYNLVGFQTNLTFGEQKRVFSMIPGLENAEFLRYGVMHRNTYVNAPKLLDNTLALRSDARIRVAGQLAGTEGYTEAIGSGLYAALQTLAEIRGLPPLELPRTTAFGALIAYATDPATEKYQPMHVNWGLVPPLEKKVRGKKNRYAAYAERADQDLATLVS